MTLKQQWPWNPGFLRLFLLAPIGVSVLCAMIFYPSGGIYALWFLTGIPLGAFLRLLYGSVGRRVQALFNHYRNEEGELRECLLVIDKLESPGVALLRHSDLVLVSIMGQHLRLPLHELRVLREGRMLPGKYVWGKRAFILHSEQATRLAFAIDEETGARWSRRLQAKEAISGA